MKLAPRGHCVAATNSAQPHACLRLQQPGAGLGANASVAQQPLCVYVHGMLSTHLPKDEECGGGTPADGATYETPSGKGSKSGAAAAAGTVLAPKIEGGLVSGATDSPLSQELLVFALDLLLSAVKRERFDTRSPQHAALLEPLLPLLQRAMRVDADAVVSLALRTLCALVPQPGRNHPALRQPQLASHPCLSDDRLLLCGGSPRPGAAPEPRRFSQQRGRPKVAP